MFGECDSKEMVAATAAEVLPVLGLQMCEYGCRWSQFSPHTRSGRDEGFEWSRMCGVDVHTFGEPKNMGTSSPDYVPSSPSEPVGPV